MRIELSKKLKNPRSHLLVSFKEIQGKFMENIVFPDTMKCFEQVEQKF